MTDFMILITKWRAHNNANICSDLGGLWTERIEVHALGTPEQILPM